MCVWYTFHRLTCFLFSLAFLRESNRKALSLQQGAFSELIFFSSVSFAATNTRTHTHRPPIIIIEKRRGHWLCIWHSNNRALQQYCAFHSYKFNDVVNPAICHMALTTSYTVLKPIYRFVLFRTLSFCLICLEVNYWLALSTAVRP